MRVRGAELVRVLFAATGGFRGFFKSIDSLHHNFFASRVGFPHFLRSRLAASAVYRDRSDLYYRIFNVAIANATQSIVTIQNLVTILLS